MHTSQLYRGKYNRRSPYTPHNQSNDKQLQDPIQDQHLFKWSNVYRNSIYGRNKGEKHTSDTEEFTPMYLKRVHWRPLSIPTDIPTTWSRIHKNLGDDAIDPINFTELEQLFVNKAREVSNRISKALLELVKRQEMNKNTGLGDILFDHNMVRLSGIIMRHSRSTPESTIDSLKRFVRIIKSCSTQDFKALVDKVRASLPGLQELIFMLFILRDP